MKFLARGSGYTVYLTADEAVLALRKGKSKGKSELPPPSVLRMHLLNANHEAKVTGLAEMPGAHNYFIGNDRARWHASVPTYAKVAYQGVYPGVNLVYYGNPARRGQLEYDFVVAPGTDPRIIELAIGGGEDCARQKVGPQVSVVSGQWSGAGNQRSRLGVSGAPKIENPKSKIDEGGNLVIRVGDGEVRFDRPIVYQTVAGGRRKYVDGRYVLALAQSRSKKPPAKISFAVSAYDHGLPLIIDPILSYSTFLGGTNNDYAYGIAVDAAGSAYVTGQTDSLDFPVRGQTQPPGGGVCGSAPNTYPCFDAFVAKLDPTGSTLVYATFLGGSGTDSATGIAVDSSGSAYVTGTTDSANFPTKNPIQRAYAGGSCGSLADPVACLDTFVTKLTPTGAALVYSTYLGGIGHDLASGITVDASGAAYVIGSTSSRDFPISAGAIQASYGGGTYNAFVTKLNAAGSAIVYSTYLGGSGEDHGAGIAVDASGDAFITGYTNSTNFPTLSPLQRTAGGGLCGATPCFDAFVAEINAAGSALIYSTYLGGGGGDYGYGIAIDAGRNAYVTGLTTSVNFPVTAGAYQVTGGGTNYDVFVAKLTPSGAALTYGTYLGGLGSEAGYGIAVDAAGNAYITGYSYGVGFPVTSPLQPLNKGINDAFVTKLNAAGSALIFSTYLGGSGNDFGQGIALDSSANVYIAGGTFSTDFPTTPGASQARYPGGLYSAFVVKISSLVLPVVSLSAASLIFPDQGVGTSSVPKTLTLSNRGDASLNVTGVVATGDFAVTSDCGPSLAPAAACTLSVTSSPAELGPRTGKITITDGAAGSPHLVELTGNGIPTAILTPTPASLTFAARRLGTPSGAQLLTLTNSGSYPLQIERISSTGEFTQTNNCPATLAPGGSCALNAVFTPRAAGVSLGQVAIKDNAPGSPQIILLTGTGTDSNLVLSKSALAFADQSLGTTSAPQTVTLTNTGTSTLSIAAIVISGDFADADPCGATVAAGVSCTLPVTFTPTAAGTRTGSLTLTDNAPGSPHTIALSGMGVAPNAALSVASVAFVAQGVTTKSAAQVVRLSNAGTAVLTIASIAASGDFAQTNTCGTSVAGGAACDISITFAPQATGALTGAVVITDNAVSASQTVALSGSGVLPFALAADRISLSVMKGSDSASFKINISSAFGFTAAASLSCAGNAPAQCIFNPADAAPGQSATLTLNNLSALAGNNLPFIVTGSNGSLAASISLTVLLADFTVSASPTAVSTTAGNSAVYSLSLTPSNSFNQATTFTCSGAPTMATCSVSPGVLTPDGTQALTAKVTVTTTARSNLIGRWDLDPRPPLPLVSPRWFSRLEWISRIGRVSLLGWISCLRQVSPLGTPRAKDLPRIVALLLALLTLASLLPCARRKLGSWGASCPVFLLLIFFLASCGGGGGAAPGPPPGPPPAPSGTPAGVYTLTVTATSGTLTHNVTASLTVN